MRKQAKDVHTVSVKAMCDGATRIVDGHRVLTGTCGGELVFQNITLTMNPPMYPHTCNQCGRTENLDAVYPRIEYR